jgi:hypothetical protein
VNVKLAVHNVSTVAVINIAVTGSSSSTTGGIAVPLPRHGYMPETNIITEGHKMCQGKQEGALRYRDRGVGGGRTDG